MGDTSEPKVTESEVVEIVKEIIAVDSKYDVSEIASYSLLEGDLGCESLGTVSIIMSLEEHFGVELENLFELAFEGDISVQAVIDAVQTKL